MTPMVPNSGYCRGQAESLSVEQSNSTASCHGFPDFMVSWLLWFGL